jgi:hypothetical protein
MNFDKIDDYIILVSYYLKLLEVPKTEITAFIESFESIVDEYKKSVSEQVSGVVIHPDLNNRINILKKFIQHLKSTQKPGII